MFSYINQLNEFNDRAFALNLSPACRVIYYTLLDLANKLKWPKEFKTSGRRLMKLTAINSRDVCFRAIERLVEDGLIVYKPSKVKGQASVFSIVDLCTGGTEHGTDGGTLNGTDGGTLNGTLNGTDGGTLGGTLIRLDKTRLDKNIIPPISPQKENQKTYDCPFDEIVKIYAEVCPSLPQVRKVDDRRKKSINARWGDTFDKDIGRVREFFSLVSKSAFLNGDNRNGWTASFDWLMNKANATKVLEGNYRGGSSGGIKGNSRTHTKDPRFRSVEECQRAFGCGDDGGETENVPF